MMYRLNMYFLAFLFVMVGISANSSSLPGEITETGVFSGESVFIQNPLLSDGKSFSITEIKVNNIKIANEINTSLIEVDFQSINLKKGDAITLNISFKGNEKPKIINPVALKPKCDFKHISSKYDKKKECFEWITTDESCQLPYIVEQQHWGKWVKCGEVISNGKADTNVYSVPVKAFAGMNLFRIRQTNLRGETWISKPFKYRSSARAVIPNVDKAGTTLTFSEETCYEIYDESGKLLLQGKAKTVNIRELALKSLFILNFENETVMFYKQ